MSDDSKKLVHQSQGLNQKMKGQVSAKYVGGCSEGKEFRGVLITSTFLISEVGKLRLFFLDVDNSGKLA